MYHQLKTQIMERMEVLQEIIQKKEKEIKKLQQGNIRASKHGKGFQYYLRSDSSDKNGTYLPKSEKRKIEQMIQHEYDEKVIKAAKQEKDLLTRLDRIYDTGAIESIYEKLPQGKQTLVNPVTETDAQFIQRWEKIQFKKLEFQSDAPEYYSNKGERMRSKSEIIIANLLEQLNIPYIYEFPLTLDGNVTVHPDFTLINVRNRRLIYWEHLGMLDDEDYLNNAMAKIRRYEDNGYYLGEQLLITGESNTKPLDIKHVKKKVLHIMEK